jgi:hypothetical protein
MFGVSGDQIRSPRELSIHEINATIPRRVRLDPDVGYTVLVFSLILLGFGVIWFSAASYYYFQQARQRDALHGDGREAIATVTKITNGRTVYARYTFHFSGADFQGEAKMDYQREPRWPDGRTKYVRVGEQIPIQFLPSDPSVNHPSTWVWWSWSDVFPQLFMLFFSSLGFVGIGLLYRERRLARIGWVTEGKVIACAPKGRRFRVDYEFYNEDQEEFDGANENSDEYKSGSNIRVIYLRKNPKRNDTYPMSTYSPVE